CAARTARGCGRDRPAARWPLCAFGARTARPLTPPSARPARRRAGPPSTPRWQPAAPAISCRVTMGDITCRPSQGKTIMSDHVKIVEVAPRDGLQNEKQFVDTAIKVELVDRLAAAGFPNVEAASFVSPKWVPQMADGTEVMAAIARRPGTIYSVLVPNLRGFEGAQAARADEVVIFGAASEAFSQRNINCSIAESIARFEPVAAAAKEAGMRLRGSISCALGCPYQGETPVAAVVDVAERLLRL